MSLCCFGAAGVPGAPVCCFVGPGRLVCPWAAAFLLYVACGLTGVSGRRRARPPARSPHASPKARSGRSRSPPVPSGPSGVLHTGGALGYRTKRVGFVATFRLAGAGKSTLKVVVSSWEYEYPQMPGVWANDDQVWLLTFRGAVCRGVLAAFVPRRARGPADSHVGLTPCVLTR